MLAPGQGSSAGFEGTVFMVRSDQILPSTHAQVKGYWEQGNRKEEESVEAQRMEKGRAQKLTFALWSSFPLSLSVFSPMFLHLFLSAVLPETLCVRSWPDLRLWPGWSFRGSSRGHGDGGVSLRPRVTYWSTSGYSSVNISGVLRTLKQQSTTDG